jgi:hypothetical protein
MNPWLSVVAVKGESSVGKSLEKVVPPTYALPTASTAIPKPRSKLDPPRKVE